MYAEIDHRTTPILEGTTPFYSFTLVDKADIAVPLSRLATALLTYYDIPSLGVVNTRNAQDVKNANDVTYDDDGLVTWAMQVADTTRISATNPLATHEALFTFTYDEGGETKVAMHKARFFITPGCLVAPVP